jgi:hypothetical protein
MTSNRQVETNRHNASKSTGPRTPDGKARASQNARKHGLAMPLAESSRGSDEIEQLAHAILGKRADDDDFALARTSAEAELELLRIRGHKASLINAMVTAVRTEASKDVSHAQDVKVEQPETFTETIAVAELIDRFRAFERYERRAFSRRKKAFRRLCELS